MRPESKASNDEQLASSFFTGIGDIEDDDHIEEKELYEGKKNEIEDYESSAGGGGGSDRNSGGGGGGGANPPGGGPRSALEIENEARAMISNGHRQISLYASEEPPEGSVSRRLQYVPPGARGGVSRAEQEKIIKRNKALARMKESGQVNEEDWKLINGDKKEKEEVQGKIDTNEVMTRSQGADDVTKVAEVAKRPDKVDEELVQERVEELLGAAYDDLDDDVQEQLLASVVAHVEDTDYGRQIVINGHVEEFSGVKGGEASWMASELIADDADIQVQEIAIDTATLSYVIKMVLETGIKITLDPLLAKIADLKTARALLLRNIEDAARASNVDGFESLVNFIGPHALKSRIDRIVDVFLRYYKASGNTAHRAQAYKLISLFERIDRDWMVRQSNGGQVHKLRAFMSMSEDAREVLTTDPRTTVSSIIGRSYSHVDARQLIDNLYLRDRKYWT